MLVWQIKDLAETINKANADAVIIATPADLTKLIRINKPTTKVKYVAICPNPRA